ncbi:hypothetical protein V1527DRAFT_451118 [Lipomyces starkeyi]
MAERLKREVKDKAHRRSGERASRDRVSGELIVLPQTLPRDLATPTDIHNDGMEPCPEASTIWLQRGADCTLTSNDAREGIAFGRSDTILPMFYLEHLLPFLFPFYRPLSFKASSYFFSLAQETANRDVVWETVLAQTSDAFVVLRQSLQVTDGSRITEHLHGAVRIMASIMQVQRFEIAVLSFNNCLLLMHCPDSF